MLIFNKPKERCQKQHPSPKLKKFFVMVKNNNSFPVSQRDGVKNGFIVNNQVFIKINLTAMDGHRGQGYTDFQSLYHSNNCFIMFGYSYKSRIYFCFSSF